MCLGHSSIHWISEFNNPNGPKDLYVSTRKQHVNEKKNRDILNGKSIPNVRQTKHKVK